MSNYTKATNFAAKDGLASGNPLKIVRGTEIDAEFNAIATAVATKLDTVSGPQYLTGIVGTNTITAVASATFAAYVAGQVFQFVSAGANTGAVTININSLGAKNITKNGTIALEGGEIAAGVMVQVTYDGTQFQLGAVSPLLANRNRFANGAFVFDQRNNGATVTVNSTAEARCQDCWIATGQSADGVFTVTQQATGGPVDTPNYSRITVTTADASIGSAQSYTYTALIEGLDVADLGFGTANARTVSIGFWFRSSLTGTFSGSLRNAAVDRSYPISWSYPSANVWQFVPIQNIPGDTTGTWLATAARAWLLTFNVGAGSTLLGTADAWAAGNRVGTTGSVQLISTNSATMDIALVQVEAGSACTPFEWVPYQAGFARVRRYFRIYRTANVETDAFVWAGQVGVGNGVWTTVHFDTPMRAAPSVNITGATFSLNNLGTPTVQATTPVSATLQFVGTSSGGGSASITSGQVTVAVEL